VALLQRRQTGTAQSGGPVSGPPSGAMRRTLPRRAHKSRTAVDAAPAGAAAEADIFNEHALRKWLNHNFFGASLATGES
jgi:hypothetical protein